MRAMGRTKVFMIVPRIQYASRTSSLSRGKHDFRRSKLSFGHAVLPLHQVIIECCAAEHVTRTAMAQAASRWGPFEDLFHS